MTHPLPSPTQPKGWKARRYQVEAALCRALAWFIPRLSRPLCLALSSALGALAYGLDRRGRRVALQNIECVFPRQFDEEQKRAIARASYRNFARTMIDLFWGLRFSRENPLTWVSVENERPILERLATEKRGAIFMCLHHGNWEWANLVGPSIQIPLVSVAENFKNDLLTSIFRSLREHTGSRIIPQENSLVHMLKRVKRGGFSGMLIDLNLRPTQAATVIEAFRGTGKEGLLMCVPLLHAVLAQRGGALLVPFTTRPRRDGGIHLTLHLPVEPAAGATLQEITQACWDSLEPTIRREPELWLWPYKHFRYLPAGMAREYPAYANRSSTFEKLRLRVAEESVREKRAG